ncbi:MAG: hypothetical protein VB949_14320 [Pseudomonadales bacterium]
MAPATRCFTAVAGLLLFWPLFGSATDGGALPYELTLSANRPPCAASRNPSVRCRGTKASQSAFTVYANTMLWFEQADAVPIAFVFVGPLAVEPFNFPSPALGIGIRQGVDGLVVEAVYGPRRSLQTVELDRWVQFHLPPHTSFWVQLNPAR